MGLSWNEICQIMEKKPMFDARTTRGKAKVRVLDFNKVISESDLKYEIQTKPFLFGDYYSSSGGYSEVVIEWLTGMLETRLSSPNEATEMITNDGLEFVFTNGKAEVKTYTDKLHKIMIQKMAEFKAEVDDVLRELDNESTRIERDSMIEVYNKFVDEGFKLADELDEIGNKAVRAN